MRCLLLCAALFASAWPGLASAQAAPALSAPAPESTAETNAPATADPQDELYRAALRALAEGRTEQAAAMLRQLLVLEPRHAGAWMDLAITQCELGNAGEAERLFGELQHRFALPAGMIEAVARYRATGCANAPARQDAVWVLAATRGRDDNVNQGASDPRFTIGTGSTLTEYELDSAFLPRADNFSQLAGSYVRPLGNAGTSLIVQAYSRWHDSVREQDTASLLAATEHTWKPGGWQLRGTAALGYVTLDRTLYQRQQQLQARATAPWKPAPNAELALSANFSRVDYPTRPAYDGNTLELGGMLAYRGKRSLGQATLTRLRDDSTDSRPGGDRNGWFGNLQWYGAATERLSLEGGLSWQQWRSAQLYSPGLIETRRLQKTTTLRTAANWQLRPHYNVVLEWRTTLNRENISLFQYNSHALQLSLRWDNF